MRRILMRRCIEMMSIRVMMVAQFRFIIPRRLVTVVVSQRWRCMITWYLRWVQKMRLL